LIRVPRRGTAFATSSAEPACCRATYSSTASTCWRFRRADKFGDNGLIVVAIVRVDLIEQVVMSCRVLGMGIETALMCELFARSRGVTLNALFIDTGKNKASAIPKRQKG